MVATEGIRQGIYQSALIRKVAQWLDAPPRPLLVCEISAEHVAAARWARRTWALEGFAIEPLSPEAINPTAIETNLLNGTELRAAVESVFRQLDVKGQELALLVPDPIVRVFVLHFDSFPRSAAEATPLLRWRLKKSVPFEAEETLISFMRQAPREDGVDIVTGLARLRIVREYEQLLEGVGMTPGVVMSSTLASMPLLDDTKPCLLARVAGKSVTTAIVREGILCGYRCTDLPTRVIDLSPQELLDEIYPVAAYYQDSWSEGIAAVRLAGLGERSSEFTDPLEKELGCPVSSLLASAAADGRIGSTLRPLAQNDLDPLIGWTLASA
jgi:type IV pilus assembly protein PilM